MSSAGAAVNEPEGRLSTDNLLLIRDGLGKSLDDYRPKEVPDWVIDASPVRTI